MKSTKDRQEQATELRKQAEGLARKKTPRLSKNNKAMAQEDISRLYHELRVQQIELEMQNEELRRLQNELEASRERYFDLYELAPVGYVVFNENGLILEANLTTANILGLARSEIIKQPLARFIVPEDLDIYSSHCKLLFETGVQQVCEIRMHKNVTRSFWARLEMTFCRDADGLVFRMVISDITKKKQTEETLKESEARYRHLVEASHDWVWEVDHDGFYTYASPQVQTILGYTPEEVIGKKPFDLMPDEEARRILRVFTTIAEKRESFHGLENINRHKDGRLIILETNGIPFFDAEGHLLGYRGMDRDITERKKVEEVLRQSEEKFRLSFMTSSDAYYWGTLDGLILEINPVFEDVFGHARNEAIGRTLQDLGFYCDPADERKVLSDLESKNHVKDFEMKSKKKNGEIITVLLSVSKMLIINQLYILGVIRDITERKQAAEYQRKLEERLQRAEKMEALGTLAGGVAHDLNNVLGVVVGYSELLLHEIDESSTLRDTVMNIMEGGLRSTAIVDDLLALARIGVSGRKVLNLNEIILDFKKSPERAKLLSYHPSVQIKTDLEPNLLNISASSVHVEKALFNLVSNACEAMAKGGCVSIRTTNQYLDKPIHGYDNIREGDYVVVSVSDTGEGIPESDLKRIFEPFYTKKIMGRSGTGLGLAVVWGTVKDHQGYINVESEEGNGSIFTIYFPVVREEITMESHSVSINDYMGKEEAILVVDDVKGQRDLAVAMLKKLNYKVASVSSGEDAVEYLKEHKVDLLVLDMIMNPGLDGLTTYKKVLEVQPKQKAIIVSGFSQSDRVYDAQALGAGAYVRKPYVLETLGLAVRDELGRK
ncbi:MAG: Sensor histidine kinase RcsC [Syntrophus sp. SKADARSKE-3]|nr:Sensor histidine kinase RcsC [Syntrophus sp. SKADARSKE-3]